ncbi:hypothetical protein LXL04_015864 [Taraxacum kok-saghyz]
MICHKSEHVPLSVLLKRESANQKADRPEIASGQANESKKVEDFALRNSSQFTGRLLEVDLGLFDGSQLETVAGVKGDNEEEKQEHAEIIAAEEPNADKAPCNNDATTKTCSEDYIALLIEHDNEESDDGSEVKGKILKISQSQDNHTLYLGNISKTWKQEEIKAEITKSNPKKKSQKQIFRGGFKVEPSTTSNKKGGNVAIKNGETSKKTEVLKVKGDSNPQQSNKKRKTPLKQTLNPPPRHSDTKKPKFGGEGQNSNSASKPISNKRKEREEERGSKNRNNNSSTHNKKPFKKHKGIESFTMTINTPQGQTIQNVGVYLPESVFWHDQLYVALLRDIMRH